MTGAFPTGNQSNIADINTAITILNNIPTNTLTSNQVLQTAVANSALAFLTANKDIFTAGVIDPILVASFLTTNIADADTIYNSLVNVQTELNSLGVVAGTGSGTGRLLDIINQITSTPGATGPEKLATYLSTNA